MSDFNLLREEHARDLGCVGRLYRHGPTGATLVHVDADYLERQFSIGFSTPPVQDTGLSHLVEHMVMCGSRRYPLDAPLVRMMQRSVLTYLNALTGRECTHYVVASPVMADLLQLADVCLDAVFHPLMTKRSFLREAHHLHLSTGAPPSRSVGIEGVVLNEMRGIYATPQRFVLSQAYQRLFPGYAYACDSGGDPCVIPDVSHADIEAYHRRHYQPGNCCFVALGALPVEDLFGLLDRVLDGFRPSPPITPPGRVASWRQPCTEQLRFASPVPRGGGDPPAGGLAAVLWETGSGTDDREVSGQQLLAEILRGPRRVRLEHEIRTAGIADGLLYSGWGRIGDHGLIQFGVHGYRGERGERGAGLAAFLGDWLLGVASQGLETDEIQAAFDRLSRAQREITRPLARRLMDSIVVSWVFGRDPLAPLFRHARLVEAKEEAVAAPGWFSGLLEAQLVGNPHRLELVAMPDREAGDRIGDDVTRRLDRIRKKLGEERLVDLARTQTAVAEGSDGPEEALERLPRLRLDQVRERPFAISTGTVPAAAVVTVLRSDAVANGVSHVALGFDLRPLDPRLLKQVGRLADWLIEYADESEAAERARLLSASAAEISGRFEIGMDASGRGQLRPRLEIRVTALDHLLSDTMRVVERLLFHPRHPGPERLRELARSRLQGRRAEGLRSPVGLASSVARRALTELGRQYDAAAGYGDLLRLQRIAEGTDDHLEKFGDALRAAHSALTATAPVTISLVGSDTALDSLLGVVAEWRMASIGAGESRSPGPRPIASGASPIGTAMGSARKTGSCVVIFDASRLSREETAAVTIGSRILGHDLALETVRMRRGAYRAGCDFDPLKGELTLYSDRDPDVARTLETYLAAGAWMREREIDQEAVERAILLAAAEYHRRPSPAEICGMALEKSMADGPDGARRDLYERILRGRAGHVAKAMSKVLDVSGARRSFCVIGDHACLDRVARSVAAEGVVLDRFDNILDGSR